MRIAGRRCSVTIDGVTKEGRVPVEVASDGFGIGIEEQLGRIVTMPVGWRVRTMYAPAIELARPRLRQVDMTDMVGAFMHRQTDAFAGRIGPIEKA